MSLAVNNYEKIKAYAIVSVIDTLLNELDEDVKRRPYMQKIFSAIRRIHFKFINAKRFNSLEYYGVTKQAYYEFGKAIEICMTAWERTEAHYKELTKREKNKDSNVITVNQTVRVLQWKNKELLKKHYKLNDKMFNKLALDYGDLRTMNSSRTANKILEEIDNELEKLKRGIE